MKNKNFFKTPFHIVDPSPWPILTAFSLFNVTSTTALYLHNIISTLWVVNFNIFITVVVISFWFRDIIREATFQGYHNSHVKQGLKIGMILFIISEVMFFFSFFWAFFYSSLNPTIEIGATWPPVGIVSVGPENIPTLNTMLLLLSGSFITYSHHALCANIRNEALFALIVTICLAGIFTLVQGYEYCSIQLAISDGIYGSVFFMLTGFHGFHVILGSILLLVSLYRMYYNHFTPTHHFGFEASIWYWHFVDIIWLLLYLSLYHWGS